jgi:hypothetical protein
MATKFSVSPGSLEERTMQPWALGPPGICGLKIDDRRFHRRDPDRRGAPPWGRGKGHSLFQGCLEGRETQETTAALFIKGLAGPRGIGAAATLKSTPRGPRYSVPKPYDNFSRRN